MKLILYHAQGNANVRASAIGLVESDLLKEFHTSIACFPGSLLDKMGNVSFLSEIHRREFDKSLQKFTFTWPIIELGRLISLRAGFSRWTKQETGVFSVEATIRRLDRKVAARLKDADKKGITGVYAYEDGAAFSFYKAKESGIACFYDLPTGYWRAKLRILEAEKQRSPNWQNTIRGLKDSKEKLARKDEEVRMADRIFVASKFTASTLKDYPGKLPPIEIIPYGFPCVGAVRNYDENPGRTIKLLFVGSLSQQKGIANLFEAVDRLGKRVSLTLVGHKASDECIPLNAGIEKHRWIDSLPHHKILEIMREHDVLVFPTLFDGFGLVITEAMSQGTPVIATYNSAGPDLIEHGKNGWLFEAGSTSDLQAIIEELAENPAVIAQAGFEAMETARRRPWSIFMHELSAAIKLHAENSRGPIRLDHIQEI